jgi:hypothetical protein
MELGAQKGKYVGIGGSKSWKEGQVTWEVGSSYSAQ